VAFIWVILMLMPHVIGLKTYCIWK
jgi:hypothetical protein